jgi:hypothetical protein
VQVGENIAGIVVGFVAEDIVGNSAENSAEIEIRC